MRLKHMVSGMVAAAMLASVPAKQVSAGTDPLIGEIMWVGYNFCPRGWADASGQLLSISQYSALFSLYGRCTAAMAARPLGCPICADGFPSAREQGLA